MGIVNINLLYKYFVGVYNTPMRYIVIFALLFPVFAQARPVSYPDGWTIMQNNDHDKNSVHLHYSPTATDSIGYRGEILRDTNTKLHFAQYNRLLKRWNLPASQANMYLKLGAGLAEQDNETDFGGQIGFAADFETRRIFFGYENRYLETGDFGNSFIQKGRVGVAPYLASYDELQTWLMFEVEHRPEEEDKFIAMPLVRFFYLEYMAEIGVSDQKDVMFNWIVRF